MLQIKEIKSDFHIFLQIIFFHVLRNEPAEGALLAFLWSVCWVAMEYILLEAWHVAYFVGSLPEALLTNKLKPWWGQSESL